MKIYLEVKDNKVAFMMELLKSLPFVKVRETFPSGAADGLKEGLKEIQAHQTGTLELPNAKKAFDQLIAEDK